MVKKDLSESLSFVHEPVNVTYKALPDSFPNHWHSFLEIVAPCNNDFVMSIDNETYHLNERQIVLVPPRKLHSIVNAGRAPQLIVQFSSDLLPLPPDFTAGRQLLYMQKVIDNNDFRDCETTPLDILYKLRDYRYSDVPFKAFYLYRGLLEFFIVLGNYNLMLNNRLSANKSLLNPVHYEKFDSVTRYIDEHYTAKISLEEVASYAGFSKYHFSRIFRQYFGLSFPEYVMNQRVKHAVEILENTDISILDAALLSGFSSYSSFIRVFKQVMRCAPSDFRKMFNSSLVGAEG